MRRPLPLTASLALSVAVFAASCTPDAPPSTTAPAKLTTPEAKKPTRPPQPMMANAAWGERIALELGADIVAPATPAPALLQQAIDLLHSLEAGSELRARNLALQAWKASTENSQRGLALAIVAASMVYDPVVDGYAERLVDAYGLAQYAGTVDSGGHDGQSLRAIVGAAGGATRQATDLIDLVSKAPKLPDAARPLLALARAAANDRSQSFFDAATLGLKARPESDRLRVALADRYVDLGFHKDAAAVVAGDKNVPAVQLAGARARVLDGDKTAVTMLQALSASLTGTDEARRSEALYWLANAQLLADDDAGAAATAAALESRPGWQREAKLVRAEIDVRAGRLAEAQALLKPLTQGTPISTMPIERRATRLMLDVSAALRDSDAVTKSARRLTGFDIDIAATEAARTEVVKPAATVDGKALWKQVAAPSASTAGMLRARRALAMKTDVLARRELDVLIKDPQNRAARALVASSTTEPAAQARAAVAALTGAGPELLEQDLVAVIDALGAAPTPGVDARLAAFVKDPRESVSKTAQRSQNDLRDPASRAKRILGERDQHEGRKRGHDDHGDDDDGHGHAPVPPGPPAP